MRNQDHYEDFQLILFLDHKNNNFLIIGTVSLSDYPCVICNAFYCNLFDKSQIFDYYIKYYDIDLTINEALEWYDYCVNYK